MDPATPKTGFLTSLDSYRRRRSWCDPNDLCRFCLDFRRYGTLRQACSKRPPHLKKTRKKKAYHPRFMEDGEKMLQNKNKKQKLPCAKKLIERVDENDKSKSLIRVREETNYVLGGNELDAIEAIFLLSGTNPTFLADTKTKKYIGEGIYFVPKKKML